MDCLFILLVIGGLGAVVAHTSKKRTAARETWATAAHRLRLVLTDGGAFSNPSMRGTLDGFRVAADVVTRGSGKNNKTNTRYRVHYPSLRLGMRLTKEVALLSSLSKGFGAQDVEVGDAELAQDLPHLLGSDWNLEMAHTQVPQGVDHRIGNRRWGSDGRRLTDPLGAERVVR